MNDTTPDNGLPVHRIEALTDGIYAVAMTLLVIELKLPEHASLRSSAALAHALVELAPKVIAWTISFFVLALYWMGHYRAFSGVRRSDGRLAALNIAQLAFVSLLPFSCSLLGEYAGPAQIVYSSNMAFLAGFAWLTSRYIHRHPELCAKPMSRAAYRGARLRTGGLILISVLAVAIQTQVPTAWGGFGNIAFMLMAAITPLSRRVERASVDLSAGGAE